MFITFVKNYKTNFHTIFWKNQKKLHINPQYIGCRSKIFNIKNNSKELCKKIRISKYAHREIYGLKKTNQYNLSPKLKTIYKDNDFYYLILEKKKMSLLEFILNPYKNVNFKQLLLITQLILGNITLLHDKCNLLHRDIKPSNICLDKNNQPNIIDFGFSKKYIINNNHIKEKKISSIIGSYNFVSKNVYNLIEPSRRDDIESLIYVYIFMLILKDNEKYIINFKLTNNDYIKHILYISNIEKNIVDNIINILNYIKELKFNTKPDYNYLIKLI